MASSYMTLLSFTTDKTQQAVKQIKSLAERPPTNIKVLGTWTSFGRYDAVCLYRAENGSDAMNFVNERIRQIDGVVNTETLSVLPETENTPGSSSR